MPDLIRLLPDSVANQIAAGEVVQRPASAVKELLENSIDAGATKIQLIVKDAGRSLIQVIDNGSGMSETDARMSFERHATSKIKTADDLFNIRTKGFRGEALASIAAVAQVELKTKRQEDSLGIQIIIEGSEVKSQEPVNTPNGTSFSVKNLFYNVPARRNFLKSNPVELKHIIDEFQRVALAHPDIHFELHHNGSEIYNVPPTALRQRIAGIMGKSYNERLVPVEENTDIVKIKGFIIKPEFTKKTRGEQFFFVNHRFIKSGYLHHAIQTAHDQLIPKENFPSYFIFLEVNPKSIDINIHPTKTEIKFEDERSIYAILHSATRRSLGIYNITPTLDFDTEMAIEIPLPDKNREIVPPKITIDPDYNPFHSEKKMTSSSFKKEKEDTLYESLYESVRNLNISRFKNKEEKTDAESIPEGETRMLIQLHKRYILCPVKSGFWVIDQNHAHQRILFERFVVSLAQHTGMSQQQLFPQVVQLNPADLSLLKELEEDLKHLGFDLSDMGGGSISVNGTPADATDENPQQLIEKLLEEIKHHSSEIKKDKYTLLARSMAKTVAIKPGRVLSAPEMNHLVDELFACEMPWNSPAGKPTILTFTLEDLEKRFNG
ncbi:MAG: DNA mismatch repair endonuclease MutL [Bacteroidota bacterium]